MLYTEAIEAGTLELLRSLMGKSYLSQFVLVGGTALALQIGHRKSVDLDLFTADDFDTNEILIKLIGDYKLKVLLQKPKTLICNINNVKIDFINYSYPVLYPVIIYEKIRLTDINDIAAMKMDAITGRGSKKDFYDLYFLLEKYSLLELLHLYNCKYQHQTQFHVVRSLTYFKDAENNPDPMVFEKNLSWEKVKKRIINEIKKL